MASYTIPQYLLDRANIHDTITRVVRMHMNHPPLPVSNQGELIHVLIPIPQPLYYDTGNISGLANEVYADSIDIDYTFILGGAPYTISRADWVDQIAGLLPQFASTQHVTS